MRKVIIVSSHFPPLNTMAAKRFGYMCKYFEENGYDYIVISMRSHKGSFFGANNDLTCELHKRKIMYIGEMGVVYPIYSFFLDFAYFYIKKRGYISRIMDEESIGWYEKVKKDIDLHMITDACCVIGTFPDCGNVLVAKYLGRKLNIPVVADIRDLISDYSEGTKRNQKDDVLERFMEKIILRRISAITTTTAGFCNILKERYPKKRIVTVYNGWMDNVELNSTEKQEEQKNNSDKYLYFAGTLYEHRIESLLLLIRLISYHNLSVYVKIRCIGINSLCIKLKEKIKEENLSEYVEVLESANESVVRSEQQKALINLVPSALDSADNALMTTIPGKLFELLKFDRPILAIIPSYSEIGKILDECNKGIASVDDKEILKFIKEGYRDFVGNINIEKYSRKQQAKKLCELLDEII